MKREINKISILVGNGFDMQVLKHLKMSNDTSYPSFYNFINWKYSNMINDNLIVKQMKCDKESEKKNWADFENTIKDIIKLEYENKNENFSNKEYINALTELQRCFSDFLNTVVTTKVLTQVDKLGKIIDTPESGFGARKSLPLYTLQFFIGDLSEEERLNMKFIKKAKHHNTVDFTIFNFNYTFLFDNYIMLDKDNFDPHVYKHSENNFHLQLFLKDGEKEERFTKLKSKIFHPHGFQHTPRSMLFGFDNPNQVLKDYKEDLYTNSEVQEYVKYFLKPYWAENEKKYKKILEKTELYIIFGLSIGESDKYWWKEIASNLIKEKAELIIYNYIGNKKQKEQVVPSDNEEQKEQVIQKFLSASDITSQEDKDKVLERIFVVNCTEEKPRYAFNVDPEKIPKEEDLI